MSKSDSDATEKEIKLDEISVLQTDFKGKEASIPPVTQRRNPTQA